ncbi:MAG: hypothetical protein ACT4NX_09535 [Deltaproteobacteria bacterium]
MKILLLSLLLFSLNSCAIVEFAGHYAAADSTPGRLKGRVYTNKFTSYEIGGLSKSWKQIDIEGGDIAYLNPGIPATITVNSTCNKQGKKVNYSLKALSENLIIGIAERNVVSRGEITISGEPAMESVYSGKLDSSDVKIAVAVMKSLSCIYDMSYASAPAGFDGGVGEFREFVAKFRLLEKP